MRNKLIVFGYIVTVTVASVSAAEPATKGSGPTGPATQAGSYAAPSQAASSRVPGMPPPGSDTKPVSKKAMKPKKLVDVNNVSIDQLKKELNVSDEVAKKIVAARPLRSKTDLVVKAGLPEGVYLSVRDEIAINDMKKPAAKKAGADKAGTKTESSKPATAPAAGK